MTIKAVLQQARQQLAGNLPPEEAAMEAQLLLRHALGNVTRAWLIAHDERQKRQVIAIQYTEFLNRDAMQEIEEMDRSDIVQGWSGEQSTAVSRARKAPSLARSGTSSRCDSSSTVRPSCSRVASMSALMASGSAR